MISENKKEVSQRTVYLSGGVSLDSGVGVVVGVEQGVVELTLGVYPYGKACSINEYSNILSRS